MTNAEIGARIEARRKELGYTLEDVSRGVGVTRSTIQRYEKGLIEKIKLPVIEAIARYLKVNPAWLVGKSDQMLPNMHEYSLHMPDGRIIKGQLPPAKTMTQTEFLQFALWGGAEDMDEEDLKAVLDYAEYLRLKKQKDK